MLRSSADRRPARGPGGERIGQIEAIRLPPSAEWPRGKLAPRVVIGPRIPDEAFRTVVERHRDWLATTPGEKVEAGQASSDNVAQSLGLDGEDDRRAFELVSFMLGELREMDPESIPEQHLYAALGTSWRERAMRAAMPPV